MILSPTSKISHHHKVTNITMSSTSLSPRIDKSQIDVGDGCCRQIVLRCCRLEKSHQTDCSNITINITSFTLTKAPKIVNNIIATTFMFFVTVMLVTTLCSSIYDGEYVSWSDSNTSHMKTIQKEQNKHPNWGLQWVLIGLIMDLARAFSDVLMPHTCLKLLIELTLS